MLSSRSDSGDFFGAQPPANTATIAAMQHAATSAAARRLAEGADADDGAAACPDFI